ncbi:MAG: rod shape-determining protein MreC [Gammaproteobacteria bacterium]
MSLDHIGNHKRLNVSFKFFSLCVVSLFLIYLDLSGNITSYARRAIALSVYPLYSIYNFSIDTSQQVSFYFLERGDLYEQINQIQAENDEINIRLQTLESFENENQRLRDLLNVIPREEINFLASTVIDSSMNPFEHRIVIQSGSRQGVAMGSTVISAGGVVGQVFSTTDLISQVILITDPDHAIPVILPRTGFRTIAYGIGNEAELSLPFVTPDQDIEIGDRFVTSGLGNTFIPNFFVGEVIEFSESQEGPFANLRIRVGFEVNKVNEVLVLN